MTRLALAVARTLLAMIEIALKAIGLIVRLPDGEEELPPTPRHASAPDGYRCADCAIDGHACPTCYAAWWAKKHPHHRQL